MHLGGELPAARIEKLLGDPASQSLGTALGELFAELKLIPDARKFSKTTLADLFCRQELKRPEGSAPLGRLCGEITTLLQIADRLP